MNGLLHGLQASLRIISTQKHCSTTQQQPQRGEALRRPGGAGVRDGFFEQRERFGVFLMIEEHLGEIGACVQQTGFRRSELQSVRILQNGAQGFLGAFIVRQGERGGEKTTC